MNILSVVALMELLFLTASICQYGKAVLTHFSFHGYEPTWMVWLILALKVQENVTICGLIRKTKTKLPGIFLHR